MRIKEIYYKNESYTANGIKIWTKNLLFKVLLFNFAYFLYKWSFSERFLSWKQFRDKMLELKIFTAKEYKMFDLVIDSILNPLIRMVAQHKRKKCYRTYFYRVRGSI